MAWGIPGVTKMAAGRLPCGRPPQKRPYGLTALQGDRSQSVEWSGMAGPNDVHGYPMPYAPDEKTLEVVSFWWTASAVHFGIVIFSKGDFSNIEGQWRIIRS
jgi:hypothetical protein